MNDASKKIYTRGGDQGETRLLSGEVVKKDDLRVKTYGALDELQSHLGEALSLTREEPVRSMCLGIQNDIFVASSELASTPALFSQLDGHIGNQDVVRIEGWIDELTGLYGLPKHFVVPINSQAGAKLNVTRAVCRRCERLIVTLERETHHYAELIVYFNRLGDLLFVLGWCLEVKAVIRNVLLDLMDYAPS